ncbi:MULTISPECIES: flagellar hook-associated protein FlgK [unclassified Aureimonas]|uniref:flagellar hook-associated protein FlgK n=1 Tax=unclassified Aureimonas TaxID=2615206 RepID=UPI0006F823CB|nr:MULTISPECIES: flagellar hook-associated protein FlgK [unclassified Aureimonas]KQT66085.1 hypothetical protein ASG62_19940 [Aureimonas sp. Leaf427]KQT81051.1 hypothetical protein ASG54_06310 [Aureimonas sp. Leaf460]
MSLSTALDTAKTSLAASQAQTAILSRNIANVGVVGATKKYANVVTGAGGGVKITSIAQSANGVLYGNMLEAKAAVGRSNVIANGLDRLNETIGDTKLGRSPAAMISKLTAALNTLSATPGNYELARNAQMAASDLVTTLNTASETVQTVRRDADKELVNAASDMTRILAKIESLNKEVTVGTRSGADVTDLSDERDRAVAELSQYVAVTVRTRGDNDMVLYTDSGVTLFETTARKIEFSQTPGLNATIASGNAFRIDGIPVTGDTAYMPLKGGSVAGLVALRDDVMNTYQGQLDEMARGLIDATKESGAGLPDIAGLFTSADPSALATESRLNLGTFDATKLAAGEILSFEISYGGVTYKATGSALTPAELASPTAFAAKIQGMIQAAVPANDASGAPLGSGKINVQASGSGRLTLIAPSVASYKQLSISNIGASAVANGPVDATRTGGLVAAATVAVAPPTVVGLAATLKIADGVVATPQLIRDGVNGGGYDYNTSDAGGFAGRLNQMLGGLSATQTFSDASGADPTASVADYAASSISWLQALRQNSLSESEYKTTLLQSTETALSNETGINMDEQLTRLTEIQRSYQASAKLITTIDQMLATLLQSI